MKFTDTHCHIQSAGLTSGESATQSLWSKAPDLTANQLVIEAAAAGVERLICVGCDLEDSRLASNFVQAQEHCWATIGIHPHEAKRYIGQSDQLAEFSALASRNKTVAIGECGLDYFYGHSPKVDQLEILRFQIELALKSNLPIVFHVREAFDDFWPVFDSFGPGISGVMHSFTDSPANLEKALERGLFIGVNGIVTFAKNPDQLTVYKAIPLDRLVLETDAPFLTPTPYRGTINKPKYVRRVAEYLSQLRDEDLGRLAAATTTNALKLFRLE